MDLPGPRILLSKWADTVFPSAVHIWHPCWGSAVALVLAAILECSREKVVEKGVRYWGMSMTFIQGFSVKFPCIVSFLSYLL